MAEHATDGADDRIANLLPHLDAFTGFVRKRVGDPTLANDIVQDALLKAMQHSGDVRDEDHLVAWMYRILRNTIADARRRRGIEHDHQRELEEVAADVADVAELCRCITPLIDHLKPEYAAVLRDDLAGISSDQTAVRLGIDLGNLKVRRHRARAALRERLELTCRTCAHHGCLDCQCSAAPGQSHTKTP